MNKINIFWFRRDLRIEDNAGLYYALKEGLPVIPIFIFDKNILDKLENKHDARVTFIYDCIIKLNKQFNAYNSALKIFYDHPQNAFQDLLKEYTISKVFANEDYELYGVERDESIRKILSENNAQLVTYKDQVVFEKNEVLKDDGKPYTVFTPYSVKWKSKINKFFLSSYPVEKYIKSLLAFRNEKIIALEDMGFKEATTDFPSNVINDEIISSYNKTRNYPAIKGTTRLGIHLRFGTISIRKLAAKAIDENITYLNELIWRDFYFSILYHFPKVGQGHAFKEVYDGIEWRNNENEFKSWCEGNTGYPIVDAGMRELNKTGYMHNRLRMITASFLSKHLLIDWRWGEAYFAEKLLDYDFAANNGGWQWAAGSGCDASPYFRIFNPYLQTKKFDAELKYIRQWVPEFEEFSYPRPIVDHEFARKRCLEVYQKAIKIE